MRVQKGDSIEMHYRIINSASMLALLFGLTLLLGCTKLVPFQVVYLDEE